MQTFKELESKRRHSSSCASMEVDDCMDIDFLQYTHQHLRPHREDDGRRTYSSGTLCVLIIPLSMFKSCFILTPHHPMLLRFQLCRKYCPVSVHYTLLHSSSF